MPEIKSKEITVTDFIGDKVTFDKEGGYIWGVKVKEDGDYLQMIAEVRGWGAIQNLFKVGTEKFDLNDAEKFQDELGEWIADAINKKLKAESRFCTCEDKHWYGVENGKKICSECEKEIKNKDKL